MRGKADTGENAMSLQRITPACAGKSLIPGAIHELKQDHPRLCGEKLRGACNHSKVIGSPPPVRGKELPGGGFLYGSRITPACAGKRIMETVKQVFIEDHPRLCGEKCDSCHLRA